MNTLSLRGFTKSSMNLDRNSSVSTRSFSVKKNSCPSLNDSGTWTDVGSAIVISFSSKTDFMISILFTLIDFNYSQNFFVHGARKP